MDADTGAIIGNIGGFKRQHGVALANEFARGFISDGTQANVTIFDLKTLAVIGTAKSDPDTDCVVYDPASKRVFTMNGDSHNSTVIDAKSGTIVKTIDLGGSPEFAVADGKGTVYASIASKDEIAAIDSSTLMVKSRWPVMPAGNPTALAIDSQHRRLFSAGRKPQMLVVMDADSGKVIQSFPIGVAVDAAAYDADSGLVFASTRDGMVHVSTKIRLINLVSSKRSRLSSERKRWALTPRPIACSWIRRTLVRHPHPRQPGPTRSPQRFWGHFESWFTPVRIVVGVLNERANARVLESVFDQLGNPARAA